MMNACSEELGEELRGVFLPLLIILAITVPLVVLGLRHRNAAHFSHQESREQRADIGQRQGPKDTTRTSTEPNGRLDGLAGENTRRGRRDTGPEGRLAEVVGILTVSLTLARPTSATQGESRLSPLNLPPLPETPGHEVLMMLLLALLLQPLRLLLVGGGLERDAADPQRDPKQVSNPHAWDGRECRRGNGVERDDRQADQGAPGGLGHPGDEELGCGLLDLVEARVVAIAENALEQVCSHYAMDQQRSSGGGGAHN